jgi:hypothetical protein
MTNRTDSVRNLYLASAINVPSQCAIYNSHYQIMTLVHAASIPTTMTSDTTPNSPPPTQWQLWDLILSHLHNAPSSKLSISGAGRRVPPSASYKCTDFHYASDDMQKAKIAYIRLQDNMEHSILQNCILPPLDCLENQIDVLATLLVQRFEEDGIWYVAILHEGTKNSRPRLLVKWRWLTRERSQSSSSPL